MKNIKTYEGFLDLFKKKSILDYKDQIDSFLDDLKDISNEFYKDNISENIIYSFAIKKYESKKEEISLFLEEIKSACKSIGFNININSEYYSELKGEIINFIVLDFGKKKSDLAFYQGAINRLCLRLRLPSFERTVYKSNNYYKR